MSRTDWVTIAATFIAAGLGYYVKGPTAALLCLAVGGVILFFVHRRREAKKQEPEKPTTVEVKDSFNPKFVQTANPTTNVYVNHPATLPASAPVRAEKENRSKHNVKLLGAKTVNLKVYGGTPTAGALGFQETNEAKGFYIGVVACFRNEPVYEKHVKSADDTKAHLKFLDANGAEIGVGVSRPCWLDSQDDTFDLVPGGKAGCVLVLLNINGEYSTPWKHREREWNGDLMRDEHFELQALPHRIELSLLDDNDQLLLPAVTLEITSVNGVLQVTVIGKLQATIKPQS